MTEHFDAYHRWLGIPPKDQPANYYRLLGIDLFESDPEVIRDAAQRQMAHVRSYALGKHSEVSQRILNELGAAKGCLLDPTRKAEYDRKLRENRAAFGHAAEAGETSPGTVTIDRASSEARMILAGISLGSRPNGRRWAVAAGAAAAGLMAVIVVVLVARSKGPSERGDSAPRAEAPRMVATNERPGRKSISVEYSLTDLGDLSGGEDHSEALGLNNRGQVVGWSAVSDGWHAFLWQDGAMLDLGVLVPEHRYSAAHGING